MFFFSFSGVLIKPFCCRLSQPTWIGILYVIILYRIQYTDGLFVCKCVAGDRIFQWGWNFTDALGVSFRTRFSRRCGIAVVRKHVVASVNVRNRVEEIGKESINIIECFHMTSRRPYWCPKTMKRRPCWCPKLILWELNSFLMQKLSFVPINLHRWWPREWKRSILM